MTIETTLNKIKERRRWIVYTCILIISISITIGCLVYVSHLCKSKVNIESTNKAVAVLQSEIKDSKRRIDLLDEKIKREAKRIRITEKAIVNAMPADAVATSVVDELCEFIGPGEVTD